MVANSIATTWPAAINPNASSAYLGRPAFKTSSSPCMAWMVWRASVIANARPSSGVAVMSVLSGTSGVCGTFVIGVSLWLICGFSVQNLVRDTALDQLAPARAFAADKSVELFRRARLGVQPGLFQPRRHGRIAIDGGDFALDFVDDRLWRAGRRHDADPGRAFGDVGQAGGDGETRHVGQQRQRAVGVFRQRAEFAGFDQRERVGDAVLGEIDGAGQ